MSIPPVPVDLDRASLDPTQDRHDPGRDWAVLEIRADGSLGRAEVVHSTGAMGAVRASGAMATPRPLPIRSAALAARVGLLQASMGHLPEAARSFHQGARAASAVPQRQTCLEQLALVEAVQGDLRRAEVHAGLAAGARGVTDGRDGSPVRVARDWIRLERAEVVRGADLLDREMLLAGDPDPDPEPWPATAALLLRARLLVEARRPDAAVRLLTTDGAGFARTSWATSVLTAAKADAMLSAGEAHRALSTLTALPAGAAVEAGVTTAAARLTIGDVRGADAAVRQVTEALAGAPLALQIRAWLLEARIAEDRGSTGRGRSLVDRALRAAEWEGLRTPVRHEWHWVRPLVDRHPGLRRTHRDFLASLRDVRSASTGHGPPIGPPDPSDPVVGAHLTEREAQVLDLLAQMYSTDEIAAALYVSPNTVKTHLKGIFGKLCVNRRVDAVRRGRQLGLC
ncbi:MAG: LuxR-family transcriptional regulator [Aeromicrobium sp.]|nr:LuxR-family transcriptional regulator [Aeromicrobium sp.]